MTGWEELVTAALLGTDRRPLPALPPAAAALATAERDPGLAVLAAAAGLATYRRASASPATCPPPRAAPRQRLDPAPAEAQALLGRLLGGGDVELVDAWLQACALRGLGVRPGLWCRLGAAASSRGGVDPLLVGPVLGERGLAFLAQHPRWQRVARACSEAADDPHLGPAGATPRRSDPARGRSLIDRCFDAPVPPRQELP